MNPMLMGSWSVYILKCADGTYYTGATNDVNRRLRAHNAGKGAKYTASRRPCVLAASKGCLTKSEALKLERHIKSMRRSDKVACLLA